MRFMIVRRFQPPGGPVVFRAIAQADHAQASGHFAQRWRLGGAPSAEVIYTVYHHDGGWQELDGSVRWDPGRDDPYTFLDYPLAERLTANQRGIARVEAETPYGAWMCSRHFARLASLLDDELAPGFIAEEEARQARLAAGFSAAQHARGETDVELLRFCDALSLFLCLNEPGCDTWPWYRDGIAFQEASIRPRWEGANRLRLDPDPLAGPVEVSLSWDLLDEAARKIDVETVTVTVGG